MNLLLDTHVFLWTAFETGRLSARAKAAITDPGNEIRVSAVTFWEISLKYALGKIVLEGVVPEDLPGVAERMGFGLLALDAGTAASAYKLGQVGHKDPFDRMLIWQAMQHGLRLVSVDAHLSPYRKLGLEVVW